MRDDTQRWAAPVWTQPLLQSELQSEMQSGLQPGSVSPLQAPNVSVVPVQLQRQAIISGVSVVAQAAALSWPEVTQDTHYRVCLRRDRVLCINGEDRADGWDSDRQEAYSDMSHAFSVMDIGGSDALKVLQRGTELFLEEPSRSCVRQLFGYEAIVYRVQASTYRLHVSSADVESIWAHLRESIQLLKG